jgi:glycosyltransferase involved in cell wall biosynthesis
VPIVTTGIAGCSDVVRDRWNGLIVPPHAPSVLAEKIIEMLERRDAAQTMAKRARDVVRHEFGLDLVVARQAALYREIMTGTSRANGQMKAADTVPAAAMASR